MGLWNVPLPQIPTKEGRIWVVVSFWGWFWLCVELVVCDLHLYLAILTDGFVDLVDADVATSVEANCSHCRLCGLMWRRVDE
ncbi:unnamed protein product [Aspergillus oryzae]|uniref:Unnamed protein product n=2 Tax=Aspergillus oryzae TaxID=5062 RepID=A0AAN5BSS0_ASPOZ|nr:unnamed protein product [Aspergillus oryzae]GMF96246.1 unnamed protein product [Aspergillus oryzae]GMG01967.1 unnamed protein product [Aspergillus oryzae]GMG30924.1 unnamed protein product [Aspergillus oryzae]GMG43350.1 unnamed protein product [Aspergillus oryzae var. brunneus]